MEAQKRTVMSVVRIAASAVIFAALSAGCAMATPIATIGDTNLRKSPGMESPVLTLIPRGTTVEVGKCTKGWCRTSFDGRDGYIIAQNVGMGAVRPPPRGSMVTDAEGVDEEPASPIIYGGRPYLIAPLPSRGYRGGSGWGW
jgi:uncharacterized protein YgiM (DUF1202 family)